MRTGRLLVSVRGLSGEVYPVGELVRLSGLGSAVDAWVNGDWLPLSWWEFAEEPGEREEGSQPPA